VSSPEAEAIKLAASETKEIALGDGALAVDRSALEPLVQKRLQRFLSLVPKVLGGDDPKAVHDIRVWSRRLQQSLAALFPKPRPGKVRKLRRTLRQVRRALGEWRDCDVLLDLAAEELQKARGDEERLGWELVREFLRDRRNQQITLARKKVARVDVADFSKRLLKLLDRSWGLAGTEEFPHALHLTIKNGWAGWQSAITRAQATRDPTSLHALRIVSKRLRYRAELIRDLGDENAQPLLKWLKELQDVLGRWHDRQALYQAIAEALARPEVLLREPGVGRALLTEIEKGHTEQEASLEEIFRLATDEARVAELAAWIGSDQ
jgi:CHAD domain-containing protein